MFGITSELKEGSSMNVLQWRYFIRIRRFELAVNYGRATSECLDLPITRHLSQSGQNILFQPWQENIPEMADTRSLVEISLKESLLKRVSSQD